MIVVYGVILLTLAMTAGIFYYVEQISFALDGKPNNCLDI